MHIGRAIAFITVLMLMACTARAEFLCAKDFDGDGKLTTSGETALCEPTAAGHVCPLDAVSCEKKIDCPLESGRPCWGGSCQAPKACDVVDMGVITMHACRLPGKFSFHRDPEACMSACIEEAMCVETEPTCPLAEEGACVARSDGSYVCSASDCVDLSATPLEEKSIDDRVYVDDGRRDESGLCLDQIMVYSGRNMECRLAGASTAYRSCCKSFDEIMTDSTGSISEMTVITSGIGAVFEASKEAFNTYKKTKNLADTTADFNKTLKAGFDPASLAMSAAISIAIDYFVNNCNEMDMETGILNASGRCYPIPAEKGGLYCKKRLFGKGCIQEAQTYCCFNSKLGRIIHEQGRSQLKSFEGVDANNCRGFFPEEFQYLDFNQMDLSEYYGDLTAKDVPLIKKEYESVLDEYVDKVVE